MPRNSILLLLFAVCIGLFCFSAHAHLVPVFDLKKQLTEANLVCYGKAISLKAAGQEAVILFLLLAAIFVYAWRKGFRRPRYLLVYLMLTALLASFCIWRGLKGRLAKVEIISVIKGEESGSIEVLLRGDGEEEMYNTTLAENEAAILFLKSRGGHYCFVNEENSKLAVPAHKALEYKSKTDEGRLLEELLFAAANDKSSIGLHCIEELEHFPTPEVIGRLKELSKSDDVGTQGTACEVLVALDEPPDAASLAALFKRYQAQAQQSAFAFSWLLVKMETRFNIIHRDNNFVAGEKWKSFDLVSFISAILEENAKKNVFEGYNYVIAYREMADMLGWQVNAEGMPAVDYGKFRPGSRRLGVQLINNPKADEEACHDLVMKGPNLGEEALHAAAIALLRMGAESSDVPVPKSKGMFVADPYKASGVRKWLEAHPEWVKADEVGAEQSAQHWPLMDSHETVADYANRVNLPQTKSLDFGNAVKLELVLIPAGKFIMGTLKPASKISAGQKSEAALKKAKDAYQADLDVDKIMMIFEPPAHQVTLTVPFYMGKYHVTQEQYQQVMGENPSHFKGNNLPVETVTWDKAQEFCKKAGQRTGQTLRLPTEAEWEYACRAGTTTAFYTGDDEAGVKQAAWCYGNSDNKTHEVGQKTPNAWGLYDMHGNVMQWCQDCMDNCPVTPMTDPQCVINGYGAGRGGDRRSRPDLCKSALRGRYPVDTCNDYLGFRVVCAVPKKP